MGENTNTNCPDYAILTVCTRDGNSNVSCCECSTDVFEVFEDKQGNFHVDSDTGIQIDQDDGVQQTIYHRYGDVYEHREQAIEYFESVKDSIDKKAICNCSDYHCMAVWNASWNTEDEIWEIDEEPESTGCYQYDCEKKEFLEGPAIGKTTDQWETDCDSGTASYIQRGNACLNNDCIPPEKPPLPAEGCAEPHCMAYWEATWKERDGWELKTPPETGCDLFKDNQFIEGPGAGKEVGKWLVNCEEAKAFFVQDNGKCSDYDEDCPADNKPTNLPAWGFRGYKDQNTHFLYLEFRDWDSCLFGSHGVREGGKSYDVDGHVRLEALLCGKCKVIESTGNYASDHALGTIYNMSALPFDGAIEAVNNTRFNRKYGCGSENGEALIYDILSDEIKQNNL